MKLIVFLCTFFISLHGFCQQPVFHTEVMNNTNSTIYFYYINNFDSVAPLSAGVIDKEVSENNYWLFLSKSKESYFKMIRVLEPVTGNRKIVINSNESVALRSNKAEMLFDYFSSHETKENLYMLSDSIISENTDNIAAAEIIKLGLNKPETPVDTIERLYNILALNIQNSKQGKEILNYINARKFFRTGSLVKDFSLKDSSMTAVSLYNIKSDYILLDFWFSTCGPCIESFPALHDLYSKTSRNKLEIVGISVDDKNVLGNWKDAIKKYNLTWINLSDAEYAVSYYTFSIVMYPTKVLINKERRIIKINPENKEIEELVNR